MSLRNVLVQTKDRVISITAQKLINSRISKFGTMLSFSIDSSNKTAQLEVLLKGEASPIQVTLTNYQITTDAEGKSWLQVDGATASREWIDVILKEFVVGKTVELPPKASPILKILI